MVRHTLRSLAVSLCICAFAVTARAQQDTRKWYPWSGFGNDPQHTARANNPSQDLLKIFWGVPVDYSPPGLIHYGTPLCTPVNILLLPVKTGTYGDFRVEARRASNASLKWSMNTDYRVPPYSWFPGMGMTLTPNNVLYVPAAGGTVLYRKNPDGETGDTGRLAFYGKDNRNVDPDSYNSNVFINTPISSGPDGAVYFGFTVTGDTPLHLQGGIARIDKFGNGSWTPAAVAAADSGITKPVMNCAPALSRDGTTLYIGVNAGDWTGGYLVGVDAKTLAPKYHVRLKDPKYPDNDAGLADEGTASPMVGPDGDVYYGVLETPFAYNHARGWLLHFDSTLAVSKTPGAFGWDNTPSVVTPWQVGPGPQDDNYYLMTKYNNYVEGGGDGVNKIAILNPHDSMVDPISGVTVMKEVQTMPGVTPDDKGSNYPNAVREWCINTAAYDPYKQCIMANSEDGKLYRWNLITNKLDQVMPLTGGLGEAYTPTIIGTDGLVYAINESVIFCVGEKKAK